jgi:hypothetical protein
LHWAVGGGSVRPRYDNGDFGQSLQLCFKALRGLGHRSSCRCPPQIVGRPPATRTPIPAFGGLCPVPWTRGRSLVRAEGLEPSSLSVRSRVSCPVERRPHNKLAASAGLEPASPDSESGVLAAERTGNGWEWTNRTSVAGSKDRRLATNRTPKYNMG